MLRSQAWGHTPLELVVVVAGIFIAFQVDRWREGRDDVRREHEYVSALGFGHVASVLRPDLGFVLQIRLERVFLPSLVIMLAFLPVIILHTWSSVRFNGMVPGFCMGIVGVVVTIVIVSSQYSPWFPWSFPTLANMVFQSMLKGVDNPTQMHDLGPRLLGFSGLGIALVPLCLLDLDRREPE
jgi:hypothetical protein